MGVGGDILLEVLAVNLCFQIVEYSIPVRGTETHQAIDSLETLVGCVDSLEGVAQYLLEDLDAHSQHLLSPQVMRADIVQDDLQEGSGFGEEVSVDT